MLDPKLQKLLEEALEDAIRGLAKRVKKNEFSAADLAQLRAIARDAGISFNFNGQPTKLGDRVLEEMADIDPELFN